MPQADGAVYAEHVLYQSGWHRPKGTVCTYVVSVLWNDGDNTPGKCMSTVEQALA